MEPGTSKVGEKSRSDVRGGGGVVMKLQYKADVRNPPAARWSLTFCHAAKLSEL